MSLYPFALPNQPLLVLDPLADADSPPLEPDLHGAGISLPAHSPSLDDPFGDLPTTGVHPSSSQHDILTPLRQNPLLDWWTTSETPWDPIHGRNPTLPQDGSGSDYQPTGPAFAGYRSSHAFSDYDTIGHEQLPSDSGYESLSRPRHSVMGGSIYGDCDRSGETASVSNGLAGLQFDGTMPSPEPWRQQAPLHTIDVPVQGSPERKVLICPHCKSEVKTKSELNKHKQRHEKPHHCPVTSCQRTEGFSTTNDVDRHVRSCHPAYGSKGNTYMCTVEGCRSTEKRWPRADNFRQHLKRVHQILPGQEGIEKYLCKEQQPSPGPDLAGLGSAVADDLSLLDNSHDGVALSPSPWLLHPVEEEVPRDSSSFADYMSQQMFHQDTAMAQQQFGLVSATAAGHQIPNHMLQISTVGLGAETALLHVDASNVQQGRHGQQDLSDASSNGDHAMEDFASTYFNAVSVSENNPEEDSHSNIQILGELTSPEVSCEESRAFEQPSYQDAQGIGEPYLNAANDVSPQSAIPADEDEDGDDEYSSTSTLAPATSSFSETHSLIRVSPDTTTDHHARSDAANVPLDGVDIINNNDKAVDLLKALEDKGALAGILERLGYQKPKDGEAQSDVSKNGHICFHPGCGKVFTRPCELNKHTKRHLRPYGCTFPNCLKRFGSKNDWKRHENSQHYYLELWKFIEQHPSGTKLCGKTYEGLQQVKAHLLEDHEIRDRATLALKLGDCLDGHNYYRVSFWCGFCQEIVHVKEKGLKVCTWAGRIDHIDGHLKGYGGPEMNLSSWKKPDSGVSEIAFALIEPEDACKAKSSGATSASPTKVDHAGRPPKRHADKDAPQRAPKKKARLRGVWYCCGCDEQYAMDFSATCLSSQCNGHERCDDCGLDPFRSASS